MKPAGCMNVVCYEHLDNTTNWLDTFLVSSEPLFLLSHLPSICIFCVLGQPVYLTWHRWFCCIACALGVGCLFRSRKIETLVIQTHQRMWPSLHVPHSHGVLQNLLCESYLQTGSWNRNIEWVSQCPRSHGTESPQIVWIFSRMPHQRDAYEACLWASNLMTMPCYFRNWKCSIFKCLPANSKLAPRCLLLFFFRWFTAAV